MRGEQIKTGSCTTSTFKLLNVDQLQQLLDFAFYQLEPPEESVKGTEADAENVCHYKFELGVLKYFFSCEKNPQFLNFAVFSS